MKIPLILILCVLICFTIPAGAADVLSATISSGTGTPEAPPQDASVYVNDTRAAVNERNWTGALLLATRGIAWYPDNADLHSFQGYSYRKMGFYDKSIDAASRGILLDPKPVRYANRGYGYLALGNYSAALADAKTGISLDETYTTNYGVKALALQGMGRNTEALAAIGQALAREPSNAHYWHVDGRLLAAAGNCTGARYALEQSLAADPGYSLPYPGFASAQDHLATLNTTCTPAAAQLPALPSPTKSSSGGSVAIAGIGVLFALGIRK
jgi:tetratricopeptide (TPR) repeat protein